MKRYLRIPVFALILASLSACSFFNGGGKTPDESENGDKTHLLYTYDDYDAYNCYDVDNTPLSGNPKLLIIPVWFSDSSNYILSADKKANVLEDIRTAYLGTEKETGWQSVSTYYSTLSRGKCNLTGVVTDWYNAGNAMSHYASDSDATCSLVESAVKWYFSDKTSAEKKEFDTNGDGYLDGVMLIYAAPDYASLNKHSYSNLWAYTYWLQDTSLKSTSNPGPNAFFWASYDFMYGSAKSYSRTGTKYSYGSTDHCTVDAHTYIHEMGHMFGLDDYYDYSGQYSPCAGFSMQDYNVGGHDPYSVMAFGWTDPYIPKETSTYTIGNFQSTGDVILLSANPDDVNSPFDEYLLLELYTPTGLNEFDCTYTYMGNSPQGPKTSGLRIWHVDARLTQYTSRGYSTTAVKTPDKSHSGVTHMMSNTYYSSDSKDYCSPLGSSYADYNLLQLIKNNAATTYHMTGDLTSSDLFRSGDTFAFSTYSRQFVNGNAGKLNDGDVLGWTVSIDSLSSSSATITVTRNA